jgi:hypothetical protein
MQPRWSSGSRNTPRASRGEGTFWSSRQGEVTANAPGEIIDFAVRRDMLAASIQ